MCGKLKPVPWTEVPGKIIGLFHRKIGIVFQSDVCAVPYEWWPAKSCLSDCYSPSEVSPLGHLCQADKGIPWVVCIYLVALAEELKE